MSDSDYSENEDEPEVYQSSGSEWNSSEERETKRRSSRRTPARSKKKYATESSSGGESSQDDEDEESESEEEPKAPVKVRTSNGAVKKQKLEPRSEIEPKIPFSRKYATGSFLLLKTDAPDLETRKPPCIWRIDGKALLQKFEAFHDDAGKLKHKTTSVYTGWSDLDRDLYVPLQVQTVSSSPILIVEADWDKMKQVNLDSE